MKALLICPGEREAVAALADGVPLSNLPILGKRLIEYWLEHLAERGAKQVCVLATDRPEQVRALVGDGARWGLRVDVLPEVRELTVQEARDKYQDPVPSAEPWLAAPDDVQLMDHLPGLPDHALFTSYANWFAALQEWMPRAATSDRIGLRQLAAGVWVGLRARVSPEAELRAPCWIGDEVQVGAGAIIGPNSVLENGVLVEPDARISGSVVGPETFIGHLTEVRHSLVSGSTLVSWKLGSCIKVHDAFLLCPLGRQRTVSPVGLLSRLAAAWAITLTLPLALYPVLKAVLQGRRVLRPLLAVRPQSNGIPMAGDTLVYYQFVGVPGWLRRWPQLWSILRGDFGWIGNRPLSPREAARLSNDFERLWLTTSLGLISLADTEAGSGFFDDEARAHASYYAVRASRGLDVRIFARAVFLFVFGVPYSRAREYFLRVFQRRAVKQREA